MYKPLAVSPRPGSWTWNLTSAGTLTWLTSFGPPQRGDGDVHADHALVEEVRRDPGGARVRPRLGRRAPARVGVEGVEHHLAAIVAELQLREERPVPPSTTKRSSIADRLADVGGVDGRRRSRRPRAPTRSRTSSVPGASSSVEGHLRARARGLLEVARDDRPPRRPPPSGGRLQPVRAIAEPRDRLHVVRDEDHRAPRASRCPRSGPCSAAGTRSRRPRAPRR